MARRTRTYPPRQRTASTVECELMYARRDRDLYDRTLAGIAQDLAAATTDWDRRELEYQQRRYQEAIAARDAEIARLEAELATLAPEG